MTSSFFAVARQGRNGWKRYLFGIVLIFLIAGIVYLSFLFILAIITGIPIDPKALVYGNPYRYLIAQGSVGFGILLGLFFVMQKIHQRDFKTLISPDASISWIRTVKAFCHGTGLFIIGFTCWYLVVPSRYSLVFKIQEWIPFSLLTLIASVFGVTGAYLLVCGYCLQGLGLIIHRSLLLVLVWSLIICSVQFLNPPNIEIWASSFVYMMFLSALILRDNRLELVIGFGLSIFVWSLISRSAESSINFPTVFVYTPNPPFFYLN